MAQTFSDLCRERQAAGAPLFTFVIWAFIEAFTSIARENLALIIRSNRNIGLIAIATALVLLVPLLAMQLNDDVAWSAGDFAFAGAALFGTGLAFELVVRRMDNLAYRAGIGLALVSALFLVWANLAVGIIGSEDERINGLYVAVLAVGIIGAAAVRVRASGMARVLVAVASTQAAVAAIALMSGGADLAESSVSEILAVNGFFIVLFLGSAFLFQRASVTGRRNGTAA